MKVRIGVGHGRRWTAIRPASAALVDDLDELGFDSLWLPEVLTAPDARPAGRPGLRRRPQPPAQARHHHAAARPERGPAGQAAGHPRPAVGRPAPGDVRARPGPGARVGGGGGARRRRRARGWTRRSRCCGGCGRGRPSTTDGHGRRRSTGVTLAPAARSRSPLEFWTGGMVPAALERCGRFADGWLPSACTPAEAAAGRVVIDEAAGRRRPGDQPRALRGLAGLRPRPARRRRCWPPSGRARKGVDPATVVPAGLDALRRFLEAFLEVGFSKFVVRPAGPTRLVAGRARGAGRRAWATSRRDPEPTRRVRVRRPRRPRAAGPDGHGPGRAAPGGSTSSRSSTRSTDPPNPGRSPSSAGSTHQVPVITWMPGQAPAGDDRPEPTTVGLQHASGPRVAWRLRDLGPAGARGVAGHPGPPPAGPGGRGPGRRRQPRRHRLAAAGGHGRVPGRDDRTVGGGRPPRPRLTRRRHRSDRGGRAAGSWPRPTVVAGRRPAPAVRVRGGAPMIKEFKEFLLRGNLLDLAVAVVIGAAFTAVVAVDHQQHHHPVHQGHLRRHHPVRQPRLHDQRLADLLRQACLTALLNFVIVAAVIFFLVIKPVNALMGKLGRTPERGARPRVPRVPVQGARTRPRSAPTAPRR